MHDNYAYVSLMVIFGKCSEIGPVVQKVNYQNNLIQPKLEKPPDDG